MGNFFKKPIEYKAGEVKEDIQHQYVKKNGIFRVSLTKLLGVDSGGSVQVHMDFSIIGTDQVISSKELTEYTDKKTGQSVDSKGANIIRAMIGMASGKANSKAQWAAEKGKVYGKPVDGFTLPTLLKKEFYVAFQVERKIYNNKAQEECTIRRVLSASGLSLDEYEDALGQVKSETIEKIDAYVGKELEKEQEKTRKYRYKGCTEDEWNEANGSETVEIPEGGDDDDTLPTLDGDALPTVEIPDEDVIPEENTPTNDNTDELETDGLPIIPEDSEVTL